MKTPRKRTALRGEIRQGPDTVRYIIKEVFVDSGRTCCLWMNVECESVHGAQVEMEGALKALEQTLDLRRLKVHGERAIKHTNP